MAVTRVPLSTVQVAVPVHPPPFHPAKAEPAAGVAESTTVVPDWKLALQVDPQLIPAGEDETVPAPLPSLTTDTVKEFGGGRLLNVAMTEEGPVTLQTPVPEHPAPAHPANTELLSGTAVRVTVLPAVNCALQTAPQSIPSGEEVTFPEPVPDFVTLTVKGAGGMGLKIAVTVTAVAADTVQGPVGIGATHPPVHPPNTEPAAGVAERVTSVPAGNEAVHCAPQLIPFGVDVTVPSPAPPLVTVTVKGGGMGLKVAVTLVLAVRTTVQEPNPLHPPPFHPANIESAAGLAVKVMVVPALN